MLPPASASLRPRKIVGPIALLGMLFVTLIAGILIFQGNHIRRAQATDSSNLSLRWDGISSTTPVSGTTVTVSVRMRNEGPSDATGVSARLNFTQEVLTDAVWGADSGYFTLDTGSIETNLCYYWTGTCASSSATYDSGTGVWTVGNLENFNNGSGAEAQLVVRFVKTTTNANDRRVILTAEIMAGNQDDPSCPPSVAVPNNCFGDGVEQGSDLLNPVVVQPYINSNLNLRWDSVSSTSPVNGEVVTVSVRIRNEGPSDATGVTARLNFTQQMLVGEIWEADSGYFTLDTGTIETNLCHYWAGTCATSSATYDSGTGVWTIGNLENFNDGSGAEEELVVRFTKTTTNANDRRVVLIAEIMHGDQADISCDGNIYAITNCFGDGVEQGSDLLNPVMVQPYISSNLSLRWDYISSATPVSGEVVTVSVRMRNEGPSDATGVTARLNFAQQVLTDAVWGSDSGYFTLDTGTIKTNLCHYWAGTCVTSSATYDSGTGVWTIGNLENFNDGSGAEEELVVKFTKTTTNANDRQVVLTAEIMHGDQADTSCGGGLYAVTNCFGDGAEQGSDLITASVRPYLRSDLQIYYRSISDSTPVNGTPVTVMVGLRNYGPITATGVSARLKFSQEVLVDGVWGTDSGYFSLDTGSIQNQLCDYYVDTCVDGTSTYDPDTGAWSIGNVNVFAGETGWQEIRLTLRFTKTTTNANDRRVVMTTEIMHGDQADPSCDGNPYATANCFNDGADQGGDFAVASVRPYLRSDLQIYYRSISDATPVNGTAVTVMVGLRNYGPVNATGVTARLNFTQEVLTDAVWGADSGYFSLDTGSIQNQLCDYYADTCVDGTSTYDPDTGAWSIGNVNVFAGETGWQEIRLTLHFTKTTTNANDRRVVMTTEIMHGDQADPSCDGNPYATANCFNDGADQGGDFAVASVRPYLRSDLYLGLSISSSSPTAGDVMTQRVTLYNNGLSTATNVHVRYRLPNNDVFVSSDQATYDAASGDWLVASLAPSTNVELNISTRPLGTSLFTLTAEIFAGDQADPSCDGNPYATANCFNDQINQGGDYLQAEFTPVISPLSSDINVTMVVNNSTPPVGTDVTYTITIHNSGPASATSVALTDVMPAGLSYVSDTDSQYFDHGTNIWSVGNLAVDETRTVDVVMHVNVPGLLVNRVQVTQADQIDPDSVINDNSNGQDDDAAVSINGQAIDLRLSASLNHSSVYTHQNVVYSLSITNDGPDDATGVSVLVSLPNGLQYVSDTSDHHFNEVSGLWTVGDIANGITTDISITLTPNSIASYPLVAEVYAVDQFDLDSTPNNAVDSEDDYASVTLVAVPGVGTMTGHIFTDTNANGVQEAGEVDGFATVDVLITNGSGSYHPSVNAAGNFSLSLEPATYTVVVSGGLGTAVHGVTNPHNVTILGGDSVSAGNYGISGTYTGGSGGANLD